MVHRGREVRSVDEAHEAGILLELAHDQIGCRFLQDQLDLRHRPHVTLIFEAVKPDIVILSSDPFGNYLVQKLLQYGTDEQRDEIVSSFGERMTEVALNVHGTRVVQKMVECADSPAQAALITGALVPRVMELLRDTNGNHVVQKCLAALPASASLPIFERVSSDVLAIASHRHGCCVLQRCLDHAQPAQRDAIIQEVIGHAAQLVVDPFGNYVVQYILALKQPPLSQAIVASLRGRFAELSLQKFSSNVIEKCLKTGDEEIITSVAHEIINSTSFGALLHDPFANYVVQTLLTVCRPNELDAFCDKVTPHLPSLRSTLYGKRIQAKLGRFAPHLKSAFNVSGAETAYGL